VNSLAFFDTNIFVYGDDDDSPQKQARAVQLIQEYRRADSLVISLQVLQEYYVTATRKLGVDPATAQRKVEVLARSRVLRLTESDVIGGIELHRLHRLSFWDAMILYAARLAGVETVFSEDMQHGAAYGGVRIVNPFLDID